MQIFCHLEPAMQLSTFGFYGRIVDKIMALQQNPRVANGIDHRWSDFSKRFAICLQKFPSKNINMNIRIPVAIISPAKCRRRRLQLESKGQRAVGTAFPVPNPEIRAHPAAPKLAKTPFHTFSRSKHFLNFAPIFRRNI